MPPSGPELGARLRARDLGAAPAALNVLENRAPAHREAIAALLAEVAPDTILTFGPDGVTFHSDHRTVSSWVAAAWDRAGRPGRLLHSTMSEVHLGKWARTYEDWNVYITDERPVGVPVDDLAVYTRLEGVALDQKVTALSAMYTQTAGAITMLGEAYRDLNAEECFVAAPEG